MESKSKNSHHVNKKRNKTNCSPERVLTFLGAAECLVKEAIKEGANDVLCGLHFARSKGRLQFSGLFEFFSAQD